MQCTETIMLVEYNGEGSLSETEITTSENANGCAPHSADSFLFKHGECGSLDDGVSTGVGSYYITYYVVQNNALPIPLQCKLPRYHRQSVSDIEVKVSNEA